MCSKHTATFADNNGLSNNLHHNPFLPGFSTSPGWVLATRTRGAWWCRYRGHCRSGPRHLSPRSRVCAQEWHRKDIHSHIHSHPPMHSTKTKSKTLNSPNMTPSFSCPLLSNVVLGDGQEARQMPLWTASRRRPSRLGQYWQNICRCVQQILQHRPTTIRFLTTSTITWLASAAPQADSWRLGHVEPDDVVIADIAGQTLDIFLHGPESARKNGIVKTFTHTKSKTLNSPNMTLSFSGPLLSNVVLGDGREVWQMPLWTAPRLRPSRLGQY